MNQRITPSKDPVLIDPVGRLTCPSVVPVWSQCGPSVVPVPVWSQCGPSVVPAWSLSQCGPSVVPVWSQRGPCPSVVPVCSQRGPCPSVVPVPASTWGPEWRGGSVPRVQSEGEGQYLGSSVGVRRQRQLPHGTPFSSVEGSEGRGLSERGVVSLRGVVGLRDLRAWKVLKGAWSV
uniref:Uncharacterized protein n=1 Tax=Knipowitschia caucasica TaxID=637954 RepID=A0AAV2JFB0_KNICA